MKRRIRQKDINVFDLCSLECRRAFKGNKYFKGVYASDQLQKVSFALPYGIIVNTDPSSKPGTHWIAIFAKRKDHIEYFDSFGRPPYVASIVDFLQKHSCCFGYCSIPIQDVFSVACGHFAIGFLKARFRNISCDDFLDLFDLENLSSNDQRIQKWNTMCRAYKRLKSVRSSTVKGSTMEQTNHSTCR